MTSYKDSRQGDNVAAADALARVSTGRVSDPRSYKPWSHLTETDRARYRKLAQESQKAKSTALLGKGPKPLHEINKPKLDPLRLLPKVKSNGLRALSLFSGGGGLDIGFERAGYRHVASYEIVDDAAETLRRRRPQWKIFGGPDGDVRKVDWRIYAGKVDVVHGGPPCQPFSSAGRQNGADDHRDMWPEFIRCVLEVKPRGFVAENVAALASKKFAAYVRDRIVSPLSQDYQVHQVELKAENFGVPQVRRRLFFVGIRRDLNVPAYSAPPPTHSASRPGRIDDPAQQELDLDLKLPTRACMGVREALGLPDTGYDNLAPTLRCTWTGPRGTTSILSSTAALKTWQRLGIWPNGVASDRQRARLFVAKNGDFRLSVQDCALLQGFPPSWKFFGPVYIALGQIGNAVPPPLAYQVALSVSRVLSR